MFFLGCLSVFQIVFIPGFIILKFLKLRISVLQTFLFSMGLSLLFNYIFVVLSVLSGFYTQATVVILLILEVIILIYLYGNSFKYFWKDSLSHTGLRSIQYIEGPFLVRTRERILYIRSCFRTSKDLVFWGILFLLALVILCLAFLGGLLSLGSVFCQWDAVVSWNPWAVQWSQNHFPSFTYHYPQLIPANWSLSYVLTGSTNELFTKATMAFFYFALLLILFLWGCESKSTGMLLGCIFTGLLFYVGFTRYLFSGYMDIPVAFMGMLALYLIFLAHRAPNRKTTVKYLILGALFACGSALIKQPGILLLVIYPIGVYYAVIRVKDKDRIRIRSGVCIYLILILFLVLPMYLHQQNEISKGNSISEIRWIAQSVYQGRGPVERFFDAQQLLLQRLYNVNVSFSSVGSFFRENSLYDIIYTAISLLVLLPLTLFALALSLLRRSSRWVALLFIFYWLLWSFFMFYDIRNIALAIPWLGISIGYGLERILRWKNNCLAHKIVSGKNYLLLIMVILVILWLNLTLPNWRLSQINRTSKINHVGNSPLNHFLFGYIDHFNEGRKITSNYFALKGWPEFQGFHEYVFEDHQTGENVLNCYRKKISDPQTKYLLFLFHSYFYEGDKSAIIQDIYKRIECRQFQLIYQDKSCVMVEIIEKNKSL